MTTNRPTVDGARATEQERAVEALTEALESDEMDEKDYLIREAHQILVLQNE